MLGPTGTGGLTSTRQRKAPTRGNLTDMPLIAEGKLDPANALTRWCRSHARWDGQAQLDFQMSDPSTTIYLDFRHGGGDGMNIIYSDYSVRNVKWGEIRTKMTKQLWDNL